MSDIWSDRRFRFANIPGRVPTVLELARLESALAALRARGIEEFDLDATILGVNGNIIFKRTDGLTAEVEQHGFVKLHSPSRRREKEPSLFDLDLEVDRSVALQRKCGRLLDAWAVWMPQRVVDEQLGDSLEDLARRVAANKSIWSIRIKVALTMFWLTVHSVGYFLKESGIRKSSGS
jgi:hypothetical protein